MSRLSGIRSLLEGLRPWRHRLLWLAVAWLLLLIFAALLGLAASAAHLAVLLAAGALLLWYAVDHAAAGAVTAWPLTDVPELGGARGGDFRTANLAARLEEAAVRGLGREDLARDLHVQLAAIVAERLDAKHGITIEAEPKWAKGVMPPELWDLVTQPPPRDLADPTRLDQTLRRIEQW